MRGREGAVGSQDSEVVRKVWVVVVKQSTFVALVLGVVGGIFFALGMCAALVEEWGMMSQGIVIGLIGMAILLADVLIWRKMTGKAHPHVSKRAVLGVTLGVVGALLLGTGMTLVMVAQLMLPGIVVGLVGIAVLLATIPVGAGLQGASQEDPENSLQKY